MYRVRFNLESGPHFMQWQVRQEKSDKYYPPEKITLVMIGCMLKNKRKIAEKIHGGSKKQVCAWIECRHVDILPSDAIYPERNQIKFNPKNNPFWTNENNDNIDNTYFYQIVSRGRNLFGINDL